MHRCVDSKSVEKRVRDVFRLVFFLKVDTSTGYNPPHKFRSLYGY